MKGYRTILFNIVMTFLAAVTIVAPDADLPTADDVQSTLGAVETAIVAVWGIGNMILRAITTSPIFKKE